MPHLSLPRLGWVKCNIFGFDRMSTHHMNPLLSNEIPLNERLIENFSKKSKKLLKENSPQNFAKPFQTVLNSFRTALNSIKRSSPPPRKNRHPPNCGGFRPQLTRSPPPPPPLQSKRAVTPGGGQLNISGQFCVDESSFVKYEW